MTRTTIFRHWDLYDSHYGGTGMWPWVLGDIRHSTSDYLYPRRTHLVHLTRSGPQVVLWARDRLCISRTMQNQKAAGVGPCRYHRGSYGFQQSTGWPGRRGCCAVYMQCKSKGAQLAARVAVDCGDAGSRLSEGLIHQKTHTTFRSQKVVTQGGETPALESRSRWQRRPPLS